MYRDDPKHVCFRFYEQHKKNSGESHEAVLALAHDRLTSVPFHTLFMPPFGHANFLKGNEKYWWHLYETIKRDDAPGISDNFLFAHILSSDEFDWLRSALGFGPFWSQFQPKRREVFTLVTTRNVAMTWTIRNQVYLVIFEDAKLSIKLLRSTLFWISPYRTHIIHHYKSFTVPSFKPRI